MFPFTILGCPKQEKTKIAKFSKNKFSFKLICGSQELNFNYYRDLHLCPENQHEQIIHSDPVFIFPPHQDLTFTCNKHWDLQKLASPHPSLLGYRQEYSRGGAYLRPPKNTTDSQDSMEYTKTMSVDLEKQEEEICH